MASQSIPKENEKRAYFGRGWMSINTHLFLKKHVTLIKPSNLQPTLVQHYTTAKLTD
jgi:hypothetical protein